jgi:ABC-type lipoprotein release transport system permease subunit
VNVPSPPETTPTAEKIARTLPPLSPLTYYRRNIWRVLPVGGAIIISVFLIASIVTLLNSVDATITRHYGSLRSFSILAPQYGTDVPAAAAGRAEKLPQVGAVIVSLPYFVFLKTVFGEMPVPIYGLAPADMPKLAAATGNSLQPGGRWPALNENEVVLPRIWADNFHVKVGQSFDPNSGNRNLPHLLSRQKVVGILTGGSSVAIADMTYTKLALAGTSLRTSYILLPRRPDQLPALTKSLQALVAHPQKFGLKSSDTRLLRAFSFGGLVNELRRSLSFLYRFLTIADILVVGAVALLSGFLANIYFEQRLGEFGLLSALGFQRELMARRLIAETGCLVLVSWLLGLALAYVLFSCLDQYYMAPNGLVLSRLDWTSVLYTLPTPLLVGLASLGTVLSRLYRLDPIEIMERR